MTKEMMDRLSAILTEKSIGAVARDAALVRELWDLAFAEAIPAAKREGLARRQLLERGLLSGKQGDQARQALDDTHSQRVLLFWEQGEDAWEAKNAFDLDAGTVDRIAEVTGKDLMLFNDEAGWTYALSQDEQGPWFFRWEL